MGEIRSPIWARHTNLKLVAAAFAILAFFEVLLIVDVVSETFNIEIHVFSANHTLFEWVAVAGLGIVLVFIGVTFQRALHENRNLHAASGRASGEFLQVLVCQMHEWGLTDSELEIATLLIKGLTIKEIAEIRTTKAGTIKSQCNAVYRKANVNNRNELAAFFIEDLMNGLDLSAPGGAAIVRV